MNLIDNDIQNMFMALRFDIYSEANKFTDEQKEKLSAVMDKTSEIDFTTTNPFKIFKAIKKTDAILREFEKAFKSYGGDYVSLENKLKEIKANKINALIKLSENKRR